MKKQILMLSMCLALTSVSALAAATSSTAPKSVAPPAVKTTVPVKASVKTTAPLNVKSEGAAVQQPLTRDEVKKKIEEKMLKEREVMYNSLSLTDEQRAKAEALDVKTRNGVKPLMLKLRAEKNKLEKLKATKVCYCDLIKQKNNVKKAKKDVKNYLEDSRKSFEAILTKEQKVKFDAIQAERKAQMEKFKKTHKHHGPKGHSPEHMGPPPFGPEGPQGPPPFGPEGPHGPQGPQVAPPAPPVK